ncbi:MAG TPA: hypothetical protein VFN48_04500 [Solirubrobacteraceae bacterium]|nr:hypothetical protein [Solirubrobacteraceae bacterium]
MIYCVIPEALADELFEKMQHYYAGDPNVEVIIDRRRASRRAPGRDGTLESEQRLVRDRRRARVPGDLPETPAV